MKIICLDYDGSYEKFPELFETIIEKSHELGYKVIMATMRFETEREPLLNAIAERIPVFYTGRHSKMTFLMKLGIHPDIWIDDNPRFLFEDAC